ncbi:MAG: DUF3127 domain-containing protein [Bacteroidetes bacterium]|nr:DUF3127 domain-containing protein [Bacteroidota bacterium]
MALELEGKVYKIGTEVTGEGKNGPWKKIDFMIEYLDGQYPKKAAFSAWTDKVEMVKKLNIGDTVTVSFNIDSREYNDKFFTDLRIWKMQIGWNCRSKCCEQYSSAPQQLVRSLCRTNGR